MDQSAPKRRRVSPRTAAGASAQAATPEASGSPRKRPSFASPTKASLARHNPQILDRRRPASPANPEGSQPAARRASDAGSDQSLSDMLRPQPATTAASVAASEVGEDEAGLGPARFARRARGSLAAVPRRSPARPSPRPLPPPAPEGEDELNPFIGHTLRRSPTTGVPMPPPPEPELPPAVPDPVSSTPPRGIHSSPSRWKERDKVKKSSPLKLPPQRPGEEAGKQPGTVPMGRLQGSVSNDEPLLDFALDPTTHHARQVNAFDSEEAKKKERDELRELVAKLKDDLETASKENERIRLMQTSGRTVAPTDEDGIVALVHRYLISPEEAPRPIPSHQMMQAVLNPICLFPFGRHSPIVAPATDHEEALEDIKSHHPVPMSASEELPYLQLFSPFSVSSSIAVIPPLPNQPLRQRHLVTLRSRDVPGLFTAKVDMVVNATNLGILELGVPSLEPSAKFELGPFVDKICSGKCNRSVQRNVGVLSWAMGEWYRVAVQRARFWSRLEQRLGSKEQLFESIAETRTRRRRPNNAEDGQDEKGPVSCGNADLIRLLGQQSFEVNIPVASAADDEFTLRLEWKIGFDWTGEAQSRAAILIGVPGKWREADQRGTLGKLPKLFDDLIESGQDPELALETVAALLVGA